MYMLDTNICIYIIKERPFQVLEKFERIDPDRICISVVSQAELQFGVEKSSKVKRNQRILDEFLSRLIILPWDSPAALQYARVRKMLEQNGTPIGNMDLLIASHALSGDHCLVTNNIREFGRVTGLRTENWA